MERIEWIEVNPNALNDRYVRLVYRSGLDTTVTTDELKKIINVIFEDCENWCEKNTSLKRTTESNIDLEAKLKEANDKFNKLEKKYNEVLGQKQYWKVEADANYSEMNNLRKTIESLKIFKERDQKRVVELQQVQEALHFKNNTIAGNTKRIEDLEDEIGQLRTYICNLKKISEQKSEIIRTLESQLLILQNKYHCMDRPYKVCTWDFVNNRPLNYDISITDEGDEHV